MKRSPITRKTPLKRRARSGRARMVDATRGTKYSRRPRDWDRMRWTKLQGCALSRPLPLFPELWRGPETTDRCHGLVEAHHAGEHGVGQKAGDETVMPLCSGHHRALTDRAGIFAGWPRGAVKAWELAMVELYQLAYAEFLAGRSDETY